VFCSISSVFHKGATILAEGLSCALQWVHWSWLELAESGCVQSGAAPGLFSQDPPLQYLCYQHHYLMEAQHKSLSKLSPLSKNLYGFTVLINILILVERRINFQRRRIEKLLETNINFMYQKTNHSRRHQWI